MGGHDVYFDNFALVQQGAFGSDLLATKNGNLNTVCCCANELDAL